MSNGFHTTDVDLAAFLRYRGLRYSHLAPNPTNVTLADFIFPEGPLLFACLREWAAEDESCMVDAREFGRLRRRFYRMAHNFVRRSNS